MTKNLSPLNLSIKESSIMVHKRRQDPPDPALRPAAITYRLPSTARLALLVILAAAFLASSCQRSDTVQKERARTLSADERYIVELYIKITELEKNLQDNPDLVEEKKAELLRGTDLDRVRKTLELLEREPERWLGIYQRINELVKRSERKRAT